MLLVSSSSRNIFVQGKISVLEDNTILPVPWSSTRLHKSRKGEIKRGEDQCAISVSRFYVLISARTLFFSGFYESFHPSENPAIYGRKTHGTPTKIARVRTSARHSGNAEDQTLQCSACGKRYSLKHNLARHVRFECGGQRRFSCHLCPNKYTQNVSLRRHLTHHHNVVVPVKKRYNNPRKMYDRIVYQ